MKNEYKFVNDKVIALDDELGLLEYDYHPEIEEILIQENVIEEIQRNITSAKYALGVQNEDLKLKYEDKTKKVLSWLAPAIMSFFFSLILFKAKLVLILPFTLGITITTHTVLGAIDKDDKRKVQNTINALEVTIEELKKDLAQAKIELQALKSDKQHSMERQDKEMDMKLFASKNNNRLIKLEQLENLYYLCGYNAKEYTKYYENGTLRHQLHDEFNNEEIDVIERIIEEKGKQLVKKL